MRPEVLQEELVKILEGSFIQKTPRKKRGNTMLSLDENQMFKLWNILGEELGIDLALASDSQRKLLFEACKNGKHLESKDFSSLLWLVYYSDLGYQ